MLSGGSAPKFFSNLTKITAQGGLEAGNEGKVVGFALPSHSGTQDPSTRVSGISPQGWVFSSVLCIR